MGNKRRAKDVLPQTYSSNNNGNSSTGFYVLDSPVNKKVNRSLFGKRYPTSFLNASRANNIGIEQLKDPYSEISKRRFEDAYRSDPIVRRCINLKTKFIIGKRPKTVLDIVQEFNSTQEARQALAEVMSNQEYQRVKTAIDATNRTVKFHVKLQAALKQAMIGGRSALLIEKLEGGRPADLKILNWRKLGQVHVEKDTWALQAVDYADNDRNDPLLAEEIIYFAHSDDHVTADSLYYGLSEIEPTAHISECNRLIDEEDAKEINRGLWAGFGLLRFPTNTTDSEMDDFISKFVPGLWSATSQTVTAEVHQIAHDLDKLVMERRENDRRIMAALGVPSFLMGFEDITNRATAQSVLSAWKESDLEDARTWLRNVLEPQWYDSLLMIELGLTDLSQAQIKVKQAFEDITFETLEEKSAAVLPLYKEGIIPLEKVLELLDMDDVVEQVKMEKERQDKLQEERLNIERMKAENPALQQQQQPNQLQQPMKKHSDEEPQLVAMLKAKQEAEYKQAKLQLDAQRLKVLQELQQNIKNQYQR